MTTRISVPGTDPAAVFRKVRHIRVPADASGTLRALHPLALWHVLRAYYTQRLAWSALLVFSVLLAYGGGAVLFAYHALYLHEPGPAINPWLHWLLDSSLGFLALTPPLAVIMPMAAGLATRYGNAPSDGSLRYVLIIGTVFALVTAPGPLVHDALVGRGRWLANHVTSLLGGHDRPVPEAHHMPALLDMAGQVAVGLPTYVAMAGIALLAVRLLAARRTADQ